MKKCLLLTLLLATATFAFAQEGEKLSAEALGNCNTPAPKCETECAKDNCAESDKCAQKSCKDKKDCKKKKEYKKCEKNCKREETK